MIHIVDGQTNRILDYIPLGDFWDDVHRKSLKNTLETFDFTTFADKRYSQHLSKRNRIIIPDEDGSLIEFIIENTRKYRSASGALFIDVYTVASYLELKKSAVIKPQKIENQTASTVTGIALNGTEWRPGIIEGEGTRTFPVDTYTDPYSFAKTIATEFGLERRFRVEHDGNMITNRYLDLLIRIGTWQGREIEFGTDLLGIERKEDTSNIVTALLGLGPEKEDGTRLEVLVTDDDALQRWGRRNPQTGELMHIIETYEPQFTNEEPTEQRLRELTQNELEKRVNSIVEYTTDIVDLETVPGLENKKIRFGDTLKIKDTYFNPPLYLEARVHTQERSLSDKSKKKVALGDYIEYTEEEVQAAWETLKSQIKDRLSRLAIVNINASAGTVFKNGIGTTDLKAIVYQNGQEVDQSGQFYKYKWDMFDKSGNYVTSIYTKQITVNAVDIDEKSTYIVTVSKDGEEMSSEVVTVTNVNDGEQGPPGKSSYTHLAYANSADGRTDFSLTDSNREYIGMYVDDSPTNSTDPTKYKWTLVKGADGAQGIQGPPGADGRTPYLHIAYANSADGQTGFSTTDSANKLYLGQYTDFNPADSTDPTKYSWTLIKGDKGEPGYTPIKGVDYFDGKDGQDGKSSYLWVKYSVNANGNPMTDNPKGALYIGVATTTTPTAPTSYTAYKWSLIKGADGIPGEKGQDGRTSYLHIRYSNDGGKTFTANNGETVGAWMGTYVDFTQADSTNPADYTWNKVKGEQGPQGLQGPPGADGKTYYTWIKYADSPTSGMSDTPDGKEYIGIAYNKTTPIGSSNYADYAWSKIIGDQGPQGPKGADGQTLYTWIKYADNAFGDGMSDDPTGKMYIGIAYNKTTATESTNPADYTWSAMYDTAKLEEVEEVANDAKDIADNARATADGKNTVFYQATAPSTAGRKTNDLWFDTDDGYKPYRFDGSNWIPAPFGNAAIANLDVGKIVGYQGNFNWLEAKHIKSLNGLNVGNGQFVVDANGNVKFAGDLTGATGTFSGKVEGAVVKGSEIISEVTVSPYHYRLAIIDGMLTLGEFYSANGSLRRRLVLNNSELSLLSNIAGQEGSTTLSARSLGAQRDFEIFAPEGLKLHTVYVDDIYQNGASIIASDNNVNGYWVRFADGTQICYAHHTITAPNANGSWDYKLEKDFPAAFVDAWNIGLSVMGFTDYHGYDAVDGRGTPMVAGNTISPTRYKAVLHMNAYVPSGNVHFFITAIGRWK